MVILNKDKPWHVVNPKMLEEIKQEIAENHPKLQLDIKDNIILIRGVLELVDKDRKLIDDFTILIIFPYNYPNNIPHVKEIGGRIPIEADRHIYPSTGTACLFVSEDRDNYFPINAPFRTFMEKCVTPFFFNQSYYEATKGKWLGQRPHGLNGIFDYYKEKHGDRALKIINQLIVYMAKKGVKERWPCYCDSGLELKKCHMKYLIGYRELFRKQARHLRKIMRLDHVDPKPVII